MSETTTDMVHFVSGEMMRRSTLALLAALTLFAAPSAKADTWPSRPIMLIVPFPAGGGTDAFARPLAQVLDQQLGTRVLIENRAGAGGTAGAAVASKATPDGYTFFVGAAHHAIAPSIYAKLPYDIEKDFVPIALLSRPPHVVVVHPGKVQAKTLAEFIAAAKANPGKINYASGGNGTTHHLAGELFKLVTGTNLLHVPYRGAGPMMQDLVAGHVDMAFDAMGSSGPQIKSGAIRALAIAAPQRVPAFPDLPTVKELGVDYEVATWYALWAPAGTPPAITERMQKEVLTALQSPIIKDAWEKAGSDVPNLTGEAFGKFVSQEVARWRKVVQDSNVKIEQ
ncbi:tripartite tricarboxylate transporter family receptor [Variibacter gotjawalensis]|uniref:Tripartite tricarboxylate transporter family receptor n=2 Tax=Variibacter gotjawalensis TaxID=1333996 RepID=A0A0S3PY04_9BRAD|nr:tripartite-type tricarboxylate transporter receptor subunit TctC [Variibacter gotjawalensis]BAT60771.1 tripartite tricarboxylate transporter family receptor [Variibacter gotjawalensis]